VTVDLHTRLLVAGPSWLTDHVLTRAWVGRKPFQAIYYEAVLPDDGWYHSPTWRSSTVSYMQHVANIVQCFSVVILNILIVLGRKVPRSQQRRW
jgi:hypothetical protein